jgi:hypothetical protein
METVEVPAATERSSAPDDNEMMLMLFFVSLSLSTSNS